MAKSHLCLKMPRYLQFFLTSQNIIDGFCSRGEMTMNQVPMYQTMAIYN